MECANVSNKILCEGRSERLATSRRLVKVKAVVLSLMVIMATSTSAYAKTCTGFGDVIRDSWKAAYSIAHPIGEAALKLIPVVGQNQKAVDAISKVSEDFHDFVFNRNKQSWATVGARDLPVLAEQIKQYGKLVKAGVGGVRTFTTSGLFWDKVEIEIEKLDGRAKTEVIICTWDMKSGAKNNYTEYTFSNGKNKSKKKFTINNVYGKSISVKLRNRSVANTFKYSIKSRGILDINKQKARGQNNATKKVRRK